MEPQFKFKLGDLVIPKVSWENCKLYAGMRQQTGKEYFTLPQIMVVEQRQMDECPGGVQYHYLCRAWITGAEARPILFNEIELQSYSSDDCIALFPKKG